MNPHVAMNAEWLEADGLGGFASGTVGGVLTRRYHAWLLCSRTPPSDRIVLVNGAQVRVETPSGSYELSAHQFGPDSVENSAWQHLESFEAYPHPKWRWRLPGGIVISQELCALHGKPASMVRWSLLGATCAVKLRVRFFLSGRDFHALHHENSAFDFAAHQTGQTVSFRPYEGIPEIFVKSNGAYFHQPEWYRHFYHQEEADRGFPCTEDLAAPGIWEWELQNGPAECLLTCDPFAAFDWEKEAARRAIFPSPLEQAADSYLVKRGESGLSIIAGYPWFGEWGRDTFIALRGLCIATGRLDEAKRILVDWSAILENGLFPNHFTDRDGSPEYHSVDAPLWFAVAVHDYLQATNAWKTTAAKKLLATVNRIFNAYRKGTRFHIHMDTDGLIACGAPGYQLAWMDAKVNGHVITPRIGKPIEIQALWVNTLHLVGQEALAKQATSSVRKRFLLPHTKALADVVDIDHAPGTVDETFRPNQVFALGGLPISLFPRSTCRAILDEIEAKLYTPLGLRTLDPGHPDYVSHYAGGPLERDTAYHQGTAWAWLLGPFLEAWLRSRQSTKVAKQAANHQFLTPLAAHLRQHGLGHICEISDAAAPHHPNGCPFQAWSLGEYIRLKKLLD